MPVEIKELTIKVNINQPQQNSTSALPDAAVNEPDEALLKDAVEQVLRILENKKER
ncbi:MAG TPA: DUF5908 family protein [Ferruginibacter sp.]|nr:DUF5908 family protein [Ferruginibacter sp.]HPH91689.1 DUF5908 family protein [Ferruginibacter sp.]